MLFSGSMMLPVAGWACVWQIPRRGPKCLKVVWLSTRAEEQPLTLLVISYRLCRRHKEGLQEVMEDKKNKKAPSLLQISRSIKANAAEPGSPYRSSLAEIYPNPTPPSRTPVDEPLKGSRGWMAHFITAIHVQSDSSTGPFLQPLQPLLPGFRGACKTVSPCRAGEGAA